jgi:hypothetical protein
MEYSEKNFVINDHYIEIKNRIAVPMIQLNIILCIVGAIIFHSDKELLMSHIYAGVAALLLLIIIAYWMKKDKKRILLSNISHAETYPYKEFKDVSVCYREGLVTYFPVVVLGKRPKMFFLLYLYNPDIYVAIAALDAQSAVEAFEANGITVYKHH